MVQCVYYLNVCAHFSQPLASKPMSEFLNVIHVVPGHFKMSLIYLFILLCTTAMYLPLTTKNVAHATPAQNSTREILILGGNGFIGSSLVTKLLSMDGYNVTTVNRGRYYFDSRSRIDPHVRRIICDRANIYNCSELMNSTQFYDAVVDYSSYYMEDLQVYYALF